MKRLAIILSLIFVSLFSISTSANAADASLSISGGGAKKIGATFNLTAALNASGNQICVLTFDITYPANLLELKSSSLGSPFNMATEQSSTAGTIHYSVGAGGCSTGSSTILTMSFKAKAAGNATVAFSSGEAIGGADGQQIIGISKGSTTVTMAAAAPVATNTNTNTVPAPSVTIKNPVLTKLEYSPEVTLDNITKQAKGIIFTGTADADTKINIVIASDPISASTQSDSTGSWQYTLVDWLPAGNHTLTMTAEKGDAKSSEVKTNFVVGTESKDQIAIGTELPKTVVSEPTSNTKSKLTITTMAMIAGGAVLILVTILLIVFINKRRKYLKVAREISGSMQTNSAKPKQVVQEPRIVNPDRSVDESFFSPEFKQSSKSFVNKPVNSVPIPEESIQPVTMPEDIPAPKEVKMPEVSLHQEPGHTAVSPRPLSTQIHNIKTDSEEMVIGYGVGSGLQNPSHPQKMEESETVSIPKEKVPEIDLSPGTEITFDGDYSPDDTIVQDDISKKSQ